MKQLTDSQLQLTKNILYSHLKELEELTTMNGFQIQIRDVLEVLNSQQEHIRNNQYT